MNLLASFNLNPPPANVIIAGLLAGAMIFLMACFSRSVLVGMVGTGLGWAAVAWTVFSHETGDMRGFSQVFFVPCLLVLGCVLGGFVAFLGKRLTRRPAHHPSPGQA